MHVSEVDASGCEAREGAEGRYCTYIEGHEFHPLVLQLAQVEREVEIVFGRHGGIGCCKITRRRGERLVALSEEPS